MKNSFCFVFVWPCREAHGILVPQTGIELRPTVVKALCPNHWPTREFPKNSLGCYHCGRLGNAYTGSFLQLHVNLRLSQNLKSLIKKRKDVQGVFNNIPFQALTTLDFSFFFFSPTFAAITTIVL